MRMTLEKINWFYCILDCGWNGFNAVFDASLSDCVDYYRIITVNWIQLLLLWITGLCLGGDTMDGEWKGKPVDCHDDFEKVLVTGDAEELNELKGWLFRENIRLEMERSEFLHTQEKFIEERAQFRDEMLEVNRKLVIERKRLKQDEQFFDKKMEILKNGFIQLDAERKAFEKEKLQFRSEQKAHERELHRERNDQMAEILFQGVNSQLALKKRYRDLLKMFHPDNVAGDTEMVLVINRIYEELKRSYEFGRWA